MLENEHIRLRALETTDVALLYAWENDSVNWKVSHTIAPFSKHVLIDYIHSVSDIFTDKQLRLMIEEKASGEALGTVDLFDCDFKNHRTGIGILIADPEKRNKGIASLALELILPYCFQTLSMHQVYCNVLAENEGSLRLFRKFGFEVIGVKKEWTFHQGKYYDEVLLQKLRADD
jgi:diamine N-acetyltransferase